MWLALPQIFAQLSASPSVRAIVLTGAGDRAFTAGLDLHAASTSGPLVHLMPQPQPPSSSPPNQHQETSLFSQPTGTPYTTQRPPPPPPDPPLDPARISRQLLTHIATFQSCLTSLESCPKPIISLLHGHTHGLGIDLALCTDVRIATPSSAFSVAEVSVGLAADVGTLSRLSKLVGSGSWVKDVCLTARPFGAEEARREGLVSQIVGASQGKGGEETQRKRDKEAGMRACLQWAQKIAEKSPVAVQGTKELLNWSRDRGVADGLRYTAVWNSAALQTEDTLKAMRAQLKKRTPTFEKL
ncbi:MAG: hypothetical protein LQ351_005747 [Letrouitia transgressa]|nr:MAG: hypothetical protein LQ351_005747 [Letrouitia transgressa]